MGVSTRMKRRKRRQMSAVMRHGKTAKPSHKSKGGRTGSVHSAKLQGAHHER